MNIKELAEQANGEPAWPGGVAWTWDELKTFAKLVAAHEREECAKLCDELETNSDAEFYGYEFSAAIRARSNT